jgi:hypothetical protein
MHGIDVIEEQAIDRGWVFRCSIADTCEVELTLRWADYNRWCPSGASAPRAVAEAVLACFLAHGVTVPVSMDAGRVRRLGDRADEHVMKAIAAYE